MTVEYFFIIIHINNLYVLEQPLGQSAIHSADKTDVTDPDRNHRKNNV